MRIYKKTLKFREFMKARRRPVLVLSHDNPDPDAMASMLLFRRICAEAYGLECTIGFSGIVGRAENRAMVELCSIPMTPWEELDLKSFATIILVDTQPGAGNNRLPDEVVPTIVIDHHPPRPFLKGVPWVDVRTDYGAVVTLAYEYFLAHGLKPDPLEAAAVFYALKSETQDLGREASKKDRQVYLEMVPLIDNALLYKIVYADLDRCWFRVLFHALDDARIWQDVLIADLGEITAPDNVAEIADMLLRLKGIQWTLAMGSHGGSIHLSLRTSLLDVDAGEVMEHLVEGLGTGGGHEMMAGGKLDGPFDEETVRETIAEISGKLLILLNKTAGPDELVEEHPRPRPHGDVRKD